MKYVEFYQLENSGKQAIVATCKLTEDNQVICEGEQNLINKLNTRGIKDYTETSRLKILYPKDGLVFLTQLRYNFSSGYLNASEIKEV
jgi:hypothetical protein